MNSYCVGIQIYIPYLHAGIQICVLKLIHPHYGILVSTLKCNIGLQSCALKYNSVGFQICACSEVQCWITKLCSDLQCWITNLCSASEYKICALKCNGWSNNLCNSCHPLKQSSSSCRSNYSRSSPRS